MLTNPTHKERCAWARKAIEQSIYHDEEPDLKQNMTDLIADMLHLCDQEGIDPAEILTAASVHYDAEANFPLGPEPRVVITTDGGLIEDIFSDAPINVRVLNYDIWEANGVDSDTEYYVRPAPNETAYVSAAHQAEINQDQVERFFTLTNHLFPPFPDQVKVDLKPCPYCENEGAEQRHDYAGNPAGIMCDFCWKTSGLNPINNKNLETQ